MLDKLNPHIVKQIRAGINGLDIIHGELKVLMLEAENTMLTRSNPDHKKFYKGRLDALSELYQLTYDISFAQQDMENYNA
jgi:hypothetical protein